MTNLDSIKYWEEKLEAEKKALKGSVAYENDHLIGTMLYQIDCFREKISELLEEKTYAERHWWFMVNLAKRTRRIFKVPDSVDLYKRKKAKEYWSKYYCKKRFKIKPKMRLDLTKEEVIAYIASAVENDPNGFKIVMLIRSILGEK